MIFKRFKELLVVAFLMFCYGLCGSVLVFFIERGTGRPLNNTSDLMTINVLVSVTMVVLCLLFIQDKDVRSHIRGGTTSVIATVMCGNILLYVMVLIFSAAFPDKGYEAVQDAMSSQNSYMMLFYTLCIAPLCEEMVYRRVILHRLGHVFPGWFAITFSSVLFGVFHGNITQGIYAGLIGVVFGIVYQTYGFRMAVVAHAIFNATSLVFGSIAALLGGVFVFWCIPILSLCGFIYGLKHILQQKKRQYLVM